MHQNSKTQYMLRCFIASAALMATALPFSSAQATDLEVRKITKGEAWFPWVSGGKVDVSDRINDAIFYDIFQSSAPPSTKPALDHVDLEHTIPYGYQVLRNDDRVLSLLVEAEGCGVYCEMFYRTYAFDTTTGRRLMMDDLFTEAGIRALQSKSHESALAEIRAEIGRLHRAPADEFQSEEARGDIISQFEDCVKLHSAAMEQTDVTPGQMRIDTDGVEFTQDRCSNHALRALDALGDFQYRVPNSELQSWLTAYGRALILGAGRAKAPESPFGQVLIGTIGKAKVHISLDTFYKSGSFHGSYYYTRYRKLIALKGQAEENRLTLTEMDENNQAQAQWTLKRTGYGWEGTWSGNNGREYPIRLH